MKKFVFLFAALTVPFGSTGAQDLCTATAINALKTQYQHVKSGTLSEALYEASCTKATKRSNFGLDLNIVDLADLGFSASDGSMRQACYEKDRSYFSSYQDDLTISVLPEKAIALLGKVCFGGLRLKASIVKSVVSFNAIFRNPFNNNPALVENFSWTPDDALTCSAPLAKGNKVDSGGTDFNCERSKNTSVAVTLNTSHGSKTVWLHRTPVIRSVRYNWGYEVTGGPNTGWTTCKNQFGYVGGAIDCKGDGTCGHATPIRGLCLVRHGMGFTSVDQKRYAHKDVWSYTVKGGPNTGWTTCSLNGVDIGTPHDCRADGSCGNANAIKGWCAGRYGG